MRYKFIALPLDQKGEIAEWAFLGGDQREYEGFLEQAYMGETLDGLKACIAEMLEREGDEGSKECWAILKIVEPAVYRFEMKLTVTIEEE